MISHTQIPVIANISGNHIYLRKPISEHPGDTYLEIVLATNSRGEFVVWTHNALDGGLNGGQYSDDFIRALGYYDRRGMKTHFVEKFTE